MKILLICFSLIIIAVSSSFGQIGETESQLSSKYGKPIDVKILTPHLVLKTYKSGDLRLIVHFIDNVCEGVVFYNDSKNSDNAISSEQTKQLLQQNAFNNKWTQQPNSFKNISTWQLEIDDKPFATAILYSEGQLRIETNKLRVAIDQYSSEKFDKMQEDLHF